MSPQPSRAAVESETVELLEPKAALEAYRARGRERHQIAKLSDEAKARGYTPKEEPGEAFGIRIRARATEEVGPPLAATAKPVRSVEFELVGVSASKSGAEGAVATCAIRGGPNETAYDFLLEAPAGNFQAAQEFTVVDDEVVEAQSWWSAWVGCLYRSCASTCLASLFACTGTWAAYFWCVVARCGGCVTRCAACASCDCSWWCRWAAGCCDA